MSVSSHELKRFLLTGVAIEPLLRAAGEMMRPHDSGEVIVRAAIDAGVVVKGSTQRLNQQRGYNA